MAWHKFEALVFLEDDPPYYALHDENLREAILAVPNISMITNTSIVEAPDAT